MAGNILGLPAASTTEVNYQTDIPYGCSFAMDDSSMPLSLYKEPALTEYCWVRMPTGCSDTLVETQYPHLWFVDPSNDADSITDNDGGTACSQTRLDAFNSHCSRTDAEQYWGAYVGDAVEADYYYYVDSDFPDGPHKSCSTAGLSDIQSREGCEAAAAALGLSDTTADDFSNADLPSKCAFTGGSLFWNEAAASLGSEFCGDYDRPCICGNTGESGGLLCVLRLP